jgi:hypothetical protein
MNTTDLINDSKDVLEQYNLKESTAEYAKSLEKIANDRKMKNISKKDKETLMKIAQLMKTANEEKEEVNEKLKPGPIDARSVAGKIITGEVKLLTVQQSNPGGRQTYIYATGKPSVMGAPPDSIYIDATGKSPKGSGLAIGFRLDAVKNAIAYKDGSVKLVLK